MNPRIVLITGAAGGLGKEAALKFAKNGYTVVMTVRDSSQHPTLLSDVIFSSGNNNIYLYDLDMSSIHSIVTFSHSFSTKFQSLNVLIHNAAYVVHGAPYIESIDNIELTFATNVVGPLLLTLLLVPLLSNASDSRVIMAGSNIIKHFFNENLSVNFESAVNCPNPSRFVVYNSYRDSKMCLFWVTQFLARELRKQNISVNYLMISGARMTRETISRMSFGYRIVAQIQNMFFPTREFVAGLYFRLADEHQFSCVTGLCFNHQLQVMRPANESPGCWEQVTQLMNGQVFPRIVIDEEMQQQCYETVCSLVSKHRVFEQTGLSVDHLFSNFEVTYRKLPLL
ncbi:hypothetical protein RCL1_006670 [Eukaryota sp. TZLM3-RCL]